MVATPARPHLPHSQNFLKSRRLVDRLLDRSSIGPADLVLEIGPGKGRITERLATRCRRVVAVEKDPALAARLRRRFAGDPRVAIHEADCLDFPLPDGRYKVFANPPFDITAAIVTRLTAGPRTPDDLYLAVQREAAERFLGAPRETLYALLLKPWFAPSVIHHFDRGDFDPAPRVDVVMLRLRKRGPPLVAPCQAQPFRDFVVHGFTGSPAPAGGLRLGPFGRRHTRRLLRDLGLDPHAGPSAIPFEGWLALFRHFERAADPAARRAVAGAEEHLRRQQATLRKCHRTRARDRPRRE